MNVPPPYWAFAWAGGQALARYLLDQPRARGGQARARSRLGLGPVGHRRDEGRRALRARRRHRRHGARRHRASTRRRTASPSRRRRRSAGASRPGGCDVILVGDLFYERALADRVLALHRSCGARRARSCSSATRSATTSPRAASSAVAEYRVPVTRELEDAEIKRTAVWRFPAARRAAARTAARRSDSLRAQESQRRKRMQFAGLNLFAIVLAAVVSFMFGWLWYGVLFSEAVDGGRRQDRGRREGAGRPEPHAVRHLLRRAARHGLGARRRHRPPRAGRGDAQATASSPAPSSGSASSPRRWRSTTPSRAPSRR